jgi:hypothetical protein
MNRSANRIAKETHEDPAKVEALKSGMDIKEFKVIVFEMLAAVTEAGSKGVALGEVCVSLFNRFGSKDLFQYRVAANFLMEIKAVTIELQRDIDPTLAGRGLFNILRATPKGVEIAEIRWENLVLRHPKRRLPPIFRSRIITLVRI